MADEKALQQARNVFATLCSALDHRNWHYSRNDENLVVTLTVSGDDFPMELLIAVDPERQLVRLLSRLSNTMAEDKRIDGAVAACAAGYYMVDGNFDYDIHTGTITFRMTASFRGSLLGEGLFDYLINCACATIDEYNDKFFMLNKGLIPLTNFFEN